MKLIADFSTKKRGQATMNREELIGADPIGFQILRGAARTSPNTSVASGPARASM